MLKKVFSPDYRFSEDMDFTFIKDDVDTIKIKNAYEALIEWVYEESRIKLE